MPLKNPNYKLTRRRLKLTEYDYTIIYKKGNIVPTSTHYRKQRFSTTVLNLKTTTMTELLTEYLTKHERTENQPENTKRETRNTDPNTHDPTGTAFASQIDTNSDSICGSHCECRPRRQC